MRILSNDYNANLPKSKYIAHGGPANFARPFSSYVTSKGHEWIGVIHEYTESEIPKIKKYSAIEKKTHIIFYSQKAHFDTFMQLKKRCDIRSYFKPQILTLREQIKLIKPDILFLNGYSIFAWLLLEAANQEHVPIVTQHAGISQIEFTLYAHLYSSAARSMVLDMERDIVSIASKQIFLNKHSLDTFNKKVAHVPKNQSAIIPLPYNQAFLDQASHLSTRMQSNNKNITIGCVARWDRIKNHQAILNLAQEAKKQNLPWIFKSVTRIPDTKVQFKLKQAYAAFIKVIPPVTNTELIPFYQSLDILILPSIFETAGAVVMEAALLNKPTLISPNVGWVSEYKSADMNDWIIDFSNPKTVVRRIQKLLKNPQPTQFKKLILKQHKPNRVFSEYLKVFKSVL